MHNYSIGNLAGKIVAVKIGMDGRVTPYVRHRQPSGRMVDVLEQSDDHGSMDGAVDFVARISAGHTGVVSLEPPSWYVSYTIAAIPLGNAEPFCDGEVDFAVAGGEGFSAPEEVRFHLENGTLTWESENVSGQAVINETYPELSVILRLPPGAEGEIEFARAGELSQRLLSAA